MFLYSYEFKSEPSLPSEPHGDRNRNGRAILGDRGALEARFVGGSFDIGDLSHLFPVVPPFVTGPKGHLHTAEFHVTDYEDAVVLPAKLMALCVIDLLVDGERSGGSSGASQYRLHNGGAIREYRFQLCFAANVGLIG